MTTHNPIAIGFCAGTRIVSLRGEVAIERLAQGDQVLTLSGTGAPLKRVAAIARVTVSLAAHPAPETVQPIRIGADAFEPGVPIRDLRVAPGHGIAAEDGHGRRVLVPARLLVNGATIRREPAEGEITYLRLDVDGHDIVMADGMGAAGDGDTQANPMPAIAARTLHATLLERAQACGHALVDDPGLAVLHVGQETSPIAAEPGEYLFLLPPGCAAVTLRSRLFVPADTDPAGGDLRQLGIALHGIIHDGAEIDLAGPACGTGFLPPEGEPGRQWRWTTGDAVIDLPPRPDETTLELRYHHGWGRYWSRG